MVTDALVVRAGPVGLMIAAMLRSGMVRAAVSSLNGQRRRGRLERFDHVNDMGPAL